MKVFLAVMKRIRNGVHQLLRGCMAPPTVDVGAREGKRQKNRIHPDT